MRRPPRRARSAQQALAGRIEAFEPVLGADEALLVGPLVMPPRLLAAAELLHCEAELRGGPSLGRTDDHGAPDERYRRFVLLQIGMDAGARHGAVVCAGVLGQAAFRSRNRLVRHPGVKVFPSEAMQRSP